MTTIKNITSTLCLATCAFVAPLAVTGCSDKVSSPLSSNHGGEQGQSSTTALTESQRLDGWFAARYAEDLARSPITRSYLGDSAAQFDLDDVSQTAVDEEIAILKQRVKDLKNNFDFNALDPQSQLSYRLYHYKSQETIDSAALSNHAYIFNHMEGPHSSFPTFMINMHTVKSVQDAKAYISRLQQVKRYFSQYQSRAQSGFENGVILPKFVYPKLINASQNVLKGEPFDSVNGNSPLFNDFTSKVEALEISAEEKQDLINQAGSALLSSVKPAYQSLITMFEQHNTKATDHDGVWKLPRGAQYYENQLRHFTTTDLSADDIHALGLKEVGRIQGEMRTIINQIGFDGSLQNFYQHLRTDPKFSFANTDVGREAYMQAARQTISTMRSQLDGLFSVKPKADLIVKRVEPFRQDTAFGAFYEQPSLDGTRPGTYFINLKDVTIQPKYLLQALAYHEGIPGHHMQIAIAQELENIPEFRKQTFHTAYIEGWALYAESIPAELGLYTDPYSDFGRLSMEIFRAARLVVDTGIHTKKWTREQAVQYMLENIANPEGDIRAEIDRYIVWPGQATAYKIGMLKIQELKADAQSQLGERFDIRDFHDTVLQNGSLPLSELETVVETYIKKQAK